MMTEFLIYDLKVAVLLAIFYMFYRLMLARETFHRVNRLVLLATAIASFVLPLCVITLHETVTMEMDMSLLATDVANDATAYAMLQPTRQLPNQQRLGGRSFCLPYL